MRTERTLIDTERQGPVPTYLHQDIKVRKVEAKLCDNCKCFAETSCSCANGCPDHPDGTGKS